MAWYKETLRVLIVAVGVVELVTGAPSYPAQDLPSLLPKHQRRAASVELDDLSGIKSWAAVGDSLAAGIGAGTRLSGKGDYFCSRSNESYPSLINSDERLGPSNGRTFSFLACSGQKTPEVTQNQVATLKEQSQQVITISTGANDVGLVDILNHCIFQWNPSAVSLCSYQLTQAQNAIDSDAYSKSLDDLLNTAKGKLTADGTIYWVGYAQFFGTDDHQCDSVTWSFLWTLPQREYLTLDRRQAMNVLIVNVNQKIKDAVQRAGDRVVYVDYDIYYQSTLARFCEAGYPEPFGNREGLLFYEFYTDDTTATDTPDNPKSASVRSGNLIMNGTFEGDINAMVQQFMNNNGSAATADLQLAPLGNGSSNIQTNPSPDQANIGTQVSVIPDSYGRIFHPRRGGHTLISNLVLWSMEGQRAKQLKQNIPAKEVDSDSCPIGSGPPPPTAQCGDGGIAPPGSIVAMKQPGIATASDTFCKKNDGIVINPTDTTPPPAATSYGPDGTGEPKPDTQGIYLKVTRVDRPTDSCINNEYKLRAADCQTAFAKLSDGCDTNTQTEKHGGTLNYRCLKYTLAGTGTPKYTQGRCSLHVIQYSSKDGYKLDVTLTDNKDVVFGNTLGAVDARNAVAVSSFGNQLRDQVKITAGKDDTDPLGYAYGTQSWDSNDASRCIKVGMFVDGSRNSTCLFDC